MRYWLVASALWIGVCAVAADDKKPTVTFGGFVDTHFLFDFNEPAGNVRHYGNPTQPVTTGSRHGEFALNLAYVDAVVEAERVRARLALQFGSSVEANYVAETVQNLKHIQEAVVGYRLTDKLWIDGGIYLSHIGFESFVSKYNWNYTKSLLADLSPYYQTGVRLSYAFNPQWSAQLHVMNGWQNINDNNSNKALGAQIAYTSGPLSLTYNNFFGEEVGTQWRCFNDFIAKYAFSEAVSLAASVDVGLQRKPASSDASVWHGVALFARARLSPTVYLGARAERYWDPDGVIAQPVGAAFKSYGTALNLDVEPTKHFLFRVEGGGRWATEAVYPGKLAGRAQMHYLVVSGAFSF